MGPWGPAFFELINQGLSEIMAKGGYREGAGRKSKAEELGLREKLTPMEPEFLKALKAAIIDGNAVAMKLYADYMYGKPTDKLDVTSGGEKLEATKHEIIFRDYSKK